MERRSSTHRTSARIRIVGFVLGMAVAASVVGASLIPAGAGVLGADIAIVVAPTGELAVKQPGRVLSGTALTPTSDPATGQFTILDQTMFPLNVRVRGVPDMPGLDGTLWVELTGPDDQRLFRGSLADFRAWTDDPVLLEPGVWSTFGLRAWIPDDARPGYAGRMVQVDLGFRVSKAVSQ
jgi:hypothetical protein